MNMQHVVTTEVINQHCTEVSSRATYNAYDIHDARKWVRIFVGSANKKKQKITVWMDGELQFMTGAYDNLHGYTEQAQ